MDDSSADATTRPLDLTDDESEESVYADARAHIRFESKRRMVPLDQYQEELMQLESLTCQFPVSKN